MSTTHAAPATQEVMYAVRRADGGLMDGDYTFIGVSGPNDWAPVEDWDGDAEGEFEMVRMTVEIVARRTLPECSEGGCTVPAEFWGLCERHAREDDPDYFAANYETCGGAS